MGSAWLAHVAWQALPVWFVPHWLGWARLVYAPFSQLYQARDQTGRPRGGGGASTARLPGGSDIGGEPFLFKNKHSWSRAAKAKFTRISEIK